MAWRFLNVFQYIDEVMEAASVISAYRIHGDESTLAEDLTDVLYSVADDATGGKASETVDREKLVEAVGAIVEVFESVLKL